MRKKFLIVIACLGLATLFALDRWQVAHWRAEKTVELESTLQLCRLRLKNAVASRLDVLKSLAAIFVLHPETKPNEFAHLASQFMRFAPPIRALQYADHKTRVKFVFPPKGNEITVSNPMLLSADPERGPFVRKAINQRSAVLQGPFELRQGGLGYVVRQPIFKDDQFLGLSIGVYDLSSLISEAFEGINVKQFIFQLSDESGIQFWGDDIIPEGFQQTTIPVADSQWTMAASWRAYPNPPVLYRILVWVCGLGFLASVIKTIGLLQSQQYRLKKTVAERTAELSKTNTTLIKEISERKQTEKALRESEDRLNGFLNNCPVGLAIWDSDFRYVFINDVLQKMNGPSKEEHIGKTVQEILPKAAPVLIPVFEKIFSGGEPALNMELSGELPSSPGEITHYLVSYFPFSMTERYPDLIGGIVVDITDRKRAEEALLISNKRYQKLFHDSPVPLWEEDCSEVYDYLSEIKEKGVNDIGVYLDDHPSELKVFSQKIKILDVNQATLRLHKAESKEDLLGHLDKIFTEKSLAVFKEEIIALANGQLDFESEGEVQTLDGEPRQVFLTLYIDKEHPGSAKALLGTVDITATKQAIEKVRQSEELLLRAQEAGKVGVWELDLITQSATLSETFARIHGVKNRTYDLGEILGWVPVQDQPAIEQALQEAVKPGGEYNIEHRIIRQDTDEIRWVRAQGKVTQQRDGESYRMSGASQDITKLKLAEQERDKLQAQINQMQRMESIGNLAGGIAHDFNNILSAILGFTELALGDVDKDSTLEDYLNEVFAAGKRARDLVKQILTFARQSDEQLKPIRAGNIAREALNLLRSFIPTSIEINQKIETNALVMGNAAQIHQIFMNLCTNAAQAMEDNGGILDVSVVDAFIENEPSYPLSDMDPGDYIHIAVSDTGVGISPETIESIYEPYFTNKPFGEGTGMGLAVVHGIVESYGGKISVESKVGHGSVFHVYLPKTQKPKQDRPTTPEPIPVGHEKILFVDDEAPITRLGGKLLERMGYDVTTCTSSVEALDLFRSEPDAFDLVITDMTMPDMTGDKLAVELMGIRPEIPVILCTGYSKKLSEEQASQIGIKAFIFKPIIRAEFAHTIRKVLDSENR